MSDWNDYQLSIINYQLSIEIPSVDNKFEEFICEY